MGSPAQGSSRAGPVPAPDPQLASELAVARAPPRAGSGKHLDLCKTVSKETGKNKHKCFPWLQGVGGQACWAGWAPPVSHHPSKEQVVGRGTEDRNTGRSIMGGLEPRRLWPRQLLFFF